MARSQRPRSRSRSASSVERRLSELDPATRCPCGGLLALRPRPPPPRWQPPSGPLRGAAGAAGKLRTAPGSGAIANWCCRSGRGSGESSRRQHAAASTDRDRRWAGLTQLMLKHEGHNPTGSFKDRGMTVGVTQAGGSARARSGAPRPATPPPASPPTPPRPGIPALVLVPAGKIALGKAGPGAGLRCPDAAGAGRLRPVPRSHPGGGGPARRLPAEFGKSVPAGGAEDHRLRDCCSSWGGIRPTGSWFRRATWEIPPRSGRRCQRRAPWGSSRGCPRIAAVQADGAAPFARGFAEGFTSRRKVAAETIATAIRIGDPASWDRAVRAIRETDGVVTTVTDGEILEAKAVMDGAGVGCEPASAASVAGTRRLVREGVILRGRAWWRCSPVTYSRIRRS